MTQSPKPRFQPFYNVNDDTPSITGVGIKPKLHPDFALGTKVRILERSVRNLTGTIAGVAFAHVFYAYIIILDEGQIVPAQPLCRAVAISGCQLEVLASTQEIQ